LALGALSVSRFRNAQLPLYRFENDAGVSGTVAYAIAVARWLGPASSEALAGLLVDRKKPPLRCG